MKLTKNKLYIKLWFFRSVLVILSIFDLYRLRQLHSRKVRMEAVGVIVSKIGDTITIEKKEGEEEGNTTSTAIGTTPTPDEIHHEDEVEDMSENESEGTQPEEVYILAH